MWTVVVRASFLKSFPVYKSRKPFWLNFFTWCKGFLQICIIFVSYSNDFCFLFQYKLYSVAREGKLRQSNGYLDIVLCLVWFEVIINVASFLSRDTYLTRQMLNYISSIYFLFYLISNSNRQLALVFFVLQPFLSVYSSSSSSSLSSSSVSSLSLCE